MKPPRLLQTMSRADAVATSCTGKTRLTADLAKKLAHRAHDGRGAYRCKVCTHWHVGNSLRPEKHSGRKNASHRRKQRPATEE